MPLLVLGIALGPLPHWLVVLQDTLEGVLTLLGVHGDGGGDGVVGAGLLAGVVSHVEVSTYKYNIIITIPNRYIAFTTLLKYHTNKSRPHI